MTDSDRRNIFVRLEAAVGPVAAGNIMELLPHQPDTEPPPWFGGRLTEVRHDLGEFRAELVGELGDFRSEVRGELVELGVNTGTDLGDLRTDLGQVEDSLTGRLATMEIALRAQAQHLRRWAGGILAVNGVALAAALAV